jgi:hypothetical protein
MSPFWGDAGGLGGCDSPRWGTRLPKRGTPGRPPLKRGTSGRPPPKGGLLEVPPKFFCPVRLNKEKIKFKKQIYIKLIYVIVEIYHIIIIIFIFKILFFIFFYIICDVPPSPISQKSPKFGGTSTRPPCASPCTHVPPSQSLGGTLFLSQRQVYRLMELLMA